MSITVIFVEQTSPPHWLVILKGLADKGENSKCKDMVNFAESRGK